MQITDRDTEIMDSAALYPQEFSMNYVILVASAEHVVRVTRRFRPRLAPLAERADP